MHIKLLRNLIMSNTGWFTMNDVLNDLAEVTGTSIQSFDNRFAVSGEQPPPVIIPDEEHDLLLLYGDSISTDTTKAVPDIAGIKHMLRMVNDYFDDSTIDDNENIKELKKNANTVLTISKLNPNVPEFVPKGMSSSGNIIQENKAQFQESMSSVIPASGEQKAESSDSIIQGTTKQNKESISLTNSHVKCCDLENSVDSESLACKDNIKITNDINIKTDTSHNTCASHGAKDINIKKKIDISELNAEEIKNMSEKLKLKIINTSKADCLIKKKEKNLAIATLLKLYAEIPTNSTSSKSVKLMTPNYFESVPARKIESDSSDKFEEQHPGQYGGNNNNIMLSGESVNKKTMETLKKVDDVAYLLAEPQKSSLRPTSPTTQLQDKKSPSNSATNRTPNGKWNDKTNSMETNKSIKKVDDWLNKPEKHKLPAVFLGPVSFKRKDSKNVDIMEIPSSTTFDSENSKAKELNLTNIQKMENEAGHVQCLLQETSQQLKDSNINSKTLLHAEKPDHTHVTPDRVPEQRNIDSSMSMEIKESIKKVDNWFNPEKHKHKLPVLLLGPVTFKRKETTSLPQSVNISEETISGSESQPERPSSETSNSFVPSSYADELTKSYMERSKLKEAQSEDIWTKLERELKEKDKVLKEKMRHETQQCS
ncbi:uncharacterized protein [Epargyreus clarus]|uniref:uncharacterized protein n=1 Tax=Epargyreus clarus TaxID=520877 RepID=UPI003C2C88C6